MAYAPQLDEAIRLIDRNDKSGAQRVLARYLQSTPRDEYAWLWLAYILPDRIQQQQALQQCLKFFPGSHKAQHNLDSLRLGIPLERPSLPPDTPPHAYSSFFGRDLYIPGSGDKQQANPNSPEQPDADIEANEEISIPEYVEQPALSFEPRLVYPAMPVEPVSDSDWVHEDALESPASPEFTQPPSLKTTSRLQTTSRAGKPTQKKNVLKPWQIGCLAGLCLAILILILGGSYFLLSNPPFSDMLGCFQAVLADEFPCPECTAAVQSCPECPVQATCPPAPVPSLTPTPTLTPIPATATPTPSPTVPTTLFSPISLPAALYFLSEVAGNTQIWMLSPDGSSLAPVTAEKDPVIAFDISPTNGQVAFISNNSLILSNADGSNRRVLVPGPLLPGIDDPSYWSVALNNPLWSPDGSQLAFAQDGIQIINPLTNEIKSLTQNQITPLLPDQSRIYNPLAWSPDGTQLAVSVSRASCSNIGIVSLAGGPAIDLAALPQGNPVWIGEGTSLLLANPFADCVCAHGSGLYQIDPTTGNSVVLQGGLVTDSALSAYIGWPKLMPDGTLLYFYGDLPGPACSIPNWPGNILLNLVVGVGDRWDLRMSLRQDSYFIGEALWSADGSLAVIRNQAEEAQARYSPFVILYSDGRPAVDLPVSGRSLHWGSSSP